MNCQASPILSPPTFSHPSLLSDQTHCHTHIPPCSCCPWAGMLVPSPHPFSNAPQALPPQEVYRTHVGPHYPGLPTDSLQCHQAPKVEASSPGEGGQGQHILGGEGQMVEDAHLHMHSCMHTFTTCVYSTLSNRKLGSLWLTPEERNP